MALQELNVGRADGKRGGAGTPRPGRQPGDPAGTDRTERYRLVRDTAYTTPDDRSAPRASGSSTTAAGSARLELPEHDQHPMTTTDTAAIRLPLRSADPNKLTRFAGFAEFTDKVTGKQFYFVSVHLDRRHTGTAADQTSFDKLRAAQVTADSERTHQQESTSQRAGDDRRRLELLAERSLRRLVPRRPDVRRATPTAMPPVRPSTANTAPSTAWPTPRIGGEQIRHPAGQDHEQGLPRRRRWSNVIKLTSRLRPSDHDLVTSDLVW